MLVQKFQNNMHSLLTIMIKKSIRSLNTSFEIRCLSAKKPIIVDSV